MIFSRLAGLLLSVPLLHLSVARADIACASHAMETSAQSAQPVAMDHHAHHGAAESTPPAQPEKCDAPQARDCCASLVSCAISFDTHIAESEQSLTLASLAVPAAPLRAPLTVADAPEPPPPRG